MRKIILLLIIGLGFTLRFFDISHYPVSLNWDEASHAYNAYSIGQTGKDEWGISFPTIFRAFGDYKLPAYIYASVPFVSILGITPLSIRLVSVISGTLAILGTYFLTIQLLGNLSKSKYNASLIASLFVALSPWNIFVSRMAVEANLATTLIIFGVVLFIHAVKDEHKIRSYSLVFASILLGISLFTYNSARVFAPLIYGILVLVYWRRWGLRITIPFKVPYLTNLLNRINKPVITPTCYCHLPSFALMLLFTFSMLYQSLYTDGGSARFANISILDQGAINYINESRGLSEFSPSIARLIHNKVTYVVSQSALNYVSYFNPSFWFYQGGSHYQFSLPNFSLLPWILAPLFLIGITSLNKTTKISAVIIISWLLLAPLPASPTRDNPHVLRILVLTPILQIIGALGWVIISNKITKVNFQILFNLTIIIFLIFQTVVFWNKYTNDYAREYAWAWQSGSQTLVHNIQNLYPNYDHIYVTKKYGEPHIFFATFWPWSAVDYQQNKTWEYRDANTSSAWYWVHQLGKISFINDWEINQLTCPEQGTCLLAAVTPPTDPGWQEVDKIYNHNNEVIYILYNYAP